MVALRLDRRLQGRLDPSDVIQEAFIDATAGLAQYAERTEMPVFLWLRWLTGMKLNTLHRKHLGYQVRNAAREVSIDGGACHRRRPRPWPPSFWDSARHQAKSSFELSSNTGCRRHSTSWTQSTARRWFSVTSKT